MHTAPPAPQHPRHDSDTMQNSLDEKYEHTEPASWSARYHPFGEGHGHTSTVLGLVQGSEQDMQFLATQELQIQTLHLIRGREATPHFQGWAQQKKSDTQSRQIHTTPFAPRFHPMGGSFTQKGHGGEKGLNYTQVAQAAEDTRLNTTEQAHVGLLAEGCGRMAEFLAQAPWNERREGLGATHLGIEQHLHSHNSICHRLTLMLEDLSTEAIPTAKGKKLQQLHRILQLSRMPDWAGECLQPEISTLGFDVISARSQSSKHYGWVFCTR